MRPLLLALLCAACSRDLTVPQQVPPRIDSVQPAQGFAGDFVKLTGEGLADPSLQVLFDVRPAVIVTPPAARDGKTLVVQVPLHVLSTDVSVTGAQGSAKWGDKFTYLGAGHPTTTALRGTLSLAPDTEAVAALPSGAAVLLDRRYGTARVRNADGSLGLPARVGVLPSRVFGAVSAAWIFDEFGGGSLRAIDLSVNPPEIGARVALDDLAFLGGGAPSGAMYASVAQGAVLLYALPSGTVRSIALPQGASPDVRAVRFVGDATLVGITAAESFRIDLGPPTVVTLGPALAVAPDGVPAVDVAQGKLVYSAGTSAGLLTWTASAAPAPAATLALRVAAKSLAFSGSDVLAADPDAGVVVRCDATGALVSAQQLPGARSLAVLSDGFVLAATGAGTALLFSDGRLLRSDPVGAGLRSIGVEPLCGDVLAASDYGPLRIVSDVLVAVPLDVRLQLDGLGSGEGGVAAYAGRELYAYALSDPSDCRKGGGFQHVATSSLAHVSAVAVTAGAFAAADDQHVELFTASGAQKLDYGASGAVLPAFHGVTLTVAHPQRNANPAIATYAQGTFHELGSLTLPAGDLPSLLLRVRFADAWELAQRVFDASGVMTRTHVTFWSAAAGVLATSDVPAAVTLPAGNSADGLMLVGISGAGFGLDTLLLELAQGQLVQSPGPHVDLASAPDQILASPDGGRLYVSLPQTSALAVIE